MELESFGSDISSLSMEGVSKDLPVNFSPTKLGGKRKRQPPAISECSMPLSPSASSPPKAQYNQPARGDEDTASQDSKKLIGPTSPSFSVTKPEPLSINDLLRQHCRTRLYIKPLHWTLYHLHLLECAFKLCNKSQCPESKESTSFKTSFWEWTQKFDRVHERNHRWAWQDFKGTSLALQNGTRDVPLLIEELLQFFGLELEEKHLLAFHFDGQPVAKLATDGLFTHKIHGALIPGIAFLDLRKLSLRRNSSLHVTTASLEKCDTPNARMRQIKARWIIPDHELEDPYIAAVMISLAQLQRQTITLTQTESREMRASDDNGQSSANQSPSLVNFPCTDASNTELISEPKASELFPVSLLAYNLFGKAPQGVYLYSATISKKFLDKLEKPSQHSDAGPLEITHRRLPLGAPKRVAKILEKHVFPIKEMYRSETYSSEPSKVQK